MKRHRVRAHTRQGRPVRSYTRGYGTPKPRIFGRKARRQAEETRQEAIQKDIDKLVNMPTDDLAHKLDTDYESAKWIQDAWEGIESGEPPEGARGVPYIPWDEFAHTFNIRMEAAEELQVHLHNAVREWVYDVMRAEQRRRGNLYGVRKLVEGLAERHPDAKDWDAVLRDIDKEIREG